MSRLAFLIGLVSILILGSTDPSNAMSLREAVQVAVTTHPKVLEAAANRRSIDHELNQALGAYLPTLDLDGGIGPQFVDKPSLSSSSNAKWRTNKEINVTLRQTLFNGFDRANEVYRQAARVDGSAARVMERAELVALDAVEAFVDVKRHTQILAATDQNLRFHREILTLVWSKFRGGSSTEGELRQAEERLAAVEVLRADIRQQLGAAMARFERVIGEPPRHLGALQVPSSVPKKQGEAIMIARSSHPALNAGMSDVRAANADFDKSTSRFLPNVGLEGRASLGDDVDGVTGRSTDVSVKMTMSWNIFDGGIKQQRRLQLGEKVTESEMRLDDLRRNIDEAVRRSWSDIIANNERIAALKKQNTAAVAVTVNYDKEYEAGLRDLLDLLIAQNAAYTAQIQLISAESIGVFSQYRLLASMGQLLAGLNIEPPADATFETDQRQPWFVGGKPLIEPLRKW